MRHFRKHVAIEASLGGIKRALASVLAVISAIQSGAAAPQDVYTAQPGALEGHDSCWGTVYVPDGTPDRADLYYGGWGDAYYDYFRFQLDDAPTAAETISASLNIYVNGLAPFDPQMAVDRITQPWSEAGVSKSNNPNATYYASMPPFQAGWNTLDITSLYLGWRSGAYPNYGVKLRPTYTNQSNGSIASSDHPNCTIRPRILITYNPAGSRRLAFPLKGKAPGQDLGWTAQTAEITAVFDHWMLAKQGIAGAPPSFRLYGSDQRVQAFTGDTGVFPPHLSAPAGKNVINANLGYGADPGLTTAFLLTGCYTGVIDQGHPTGDPTLLNYDGHPAFDYRAAIGTEVYAPTDGVVYYPNDIVGARNGDAWAYYRVLELRPEDQQDLRLYFLHLSSHPGLGTQLVAAGAHVSRGQCIALTGDSSKPNKPISPHLHFEAQRIIPKGNLPLSLQTYLESPENTQWASIPVDPHGWNVEYGSDPYIQLLGSPVGLTNYRLWN